jgi:diketogulonate reductase-like aldo/keto reductase
VRDAEVAGILGRHIGKAILMSKVISAPTTTLQKSRVKCEAAHPVGALAWELSHGGVIAIPKSSNASHSRQPRGSGSLY